jgi:hypothetical protein
LQDHTTYAESGITFNPFVEERPFSAVSLEIQLIARVCSAEELGCLRSIRSQRNVFDERGCGYAFVEFEREAVNFLTPFGQTGMG